MAQFIVIVARSQNFRGTIEAPTPQAARDEMRRRIDESDLEGVNVSPHQICDIVTHRLGEGHHGKNN